MLKLARHIFLNKIGLPSAFSAAIDVTDKCNLQCSYCSIWKRKEKKDLDPRLFAQRLKKSRILRGVSLYNFGGGEPFLVDLGDYIAAVLRYGKPLQIRIVTNGSLPDVIRRQLDGLLQRSSVKIFVKVSVDGYGHAHDIMRNHEGLFAKIEETLDVLKQLRREGHAKLDYGLGFTATANNLNEIDRVHALAQKEKISFFYKPVMAVKKFNDGKLESNSFVQEHQKPQLMKFNRMLGHVRSDKPHLENFICSKFYRLMNEYAESLEGSLQCYAMGASFYMTPDGSVTPCLSRDDVMGNINSQEFDELWTGEKANVFRSQGRKKCRCLTPCDTIPSLMVRHFPFYV